MQERFEVNRNKVDVHVTPFSSNGGDDGDMFSSRMEKPLCKLNGVPHGVGDRDYIPTKDVVSGSVRVHSAERIPPYTTWIFLDRHVLCYFILLPVTNTLRFLIMCCFYLPEYIP